MRSFQNRLRDLIQNLIGQFHCRYLTYVENSSVYFSKNLGNNPSNSIIEGSGISYIVKKNVPYILQKKEQLSEYRTFELSYMSV